MCSSFSANSSASFFNIGLSKRTPLALALVPLRGPYSPFSSCSWTIRSRLNALSATVDSVVSQGQEIQVEMGTDWGNDCYLGFYCWKFLSRTSSITKTNPRLPTRFLLRGSQREFKITFSRFSRETCTFEKNIRSLKIFFIKFSTKMVLIKISVAIILTMLQRSESRANVKKTC